jgi:hypothetical protein
MPDVSLDAFSLVLWIRIQHFKWIRIRIQGFDDQKFKKIHLFLIKNCNLLIPRPPWIRIHNTVFTCDSVPFNAVIKVYNKGYSTCLLGIKWILELYLICKCLTLVINYFLPSVFMFFFYSYVMINVVFYVTFLATKVCSLCCFLTHDLISFSFVCIYILVIFYDVVLP